jgi:hypothetical protein
VQEPELRHAEILTDWCQELSGFTVRVARTAPSGNTQSGPRGLSRKSSRKDNPDMRKLYPSLAAAALTLASLFVAGGGYWP